MLEFQVIAQFREAGVERLLQGLQRQACLPGVLAVSNRRERIGTGAGLSHRRTHQMHGARLRGRKVPHRQLAQLAGEFGTLRGIELLPGIAAAVGVAAIRIPLGVGVDQCRSRPGRR